MLSDSPGVFFNLPLPEKGLESQIWKKEPKTSESCKLGLGGSLPP